MSLSVAKTSQELRDEFFNLKDRDDIAKLLDISTKQLNLNLYVIHPVKKYKIFNIPKKMGGVRKITAPYPTIKSIQSKLKQVLDAVYSPKPSTHGFVQGRSIVSNARVHKKRRYILNIDLEDFFSTIHFGRVRGMFMGNPYHLNDEVSTILAQICCFEKVLPQGAPTSPVVSNMICARLDAKLQQLAKKHQCTYSRYADDITFSTNRTVFPFSLARLTDLGQVSVGDDLSRIIEENGFEINLKKVRLQTKQRRQEVTGLTVNRYPNVQRKYIKQLRGILHAWKKFGLPTTSIRFFEKYSNYKYLNSTKSHPQFQKVILGKIEFIGMVKGKNSAVYKDLIEKFVMLAPEYKKLMPIQDSLAVSLKIGVDGLATRLHLMSSLKYFNRQNKHRKIEIDFLDVDGTKDLENKLSLALEDKNKNTKPIIFLFARNIDRSLYNKVGGAEQYKFWGNNIYSLVFPTPKAYDEPHISDIEFYYKKEDLFQKNSEGRRLFLQNEFDKTTGRHVKEKLIWTDSLDRYDLVRIVDANVFDENGINVALPRIEFAQNILNQIDDFGEIDFSGFQPLVGLISMIISDFDSERGVISESLLKPVRVFICYATNEYERVLPLYDRLVKDGMEVWMDKKSLLGGHDWEFEIRKAVRQSDVVVVCHSKSFNESGYRQKEVRLALDVAMEKPDGEIFIIPAKLEECEILESLKKWQWIELFENDGYSKLILSLRTKSPR